MIKTLNCIKQQYVFFPRGALCSSNNLHPSNFLAKLWAIFKCQTSSVLFSWSIGHINVQTDRVEMEKERKRARRTETRAGLLRAGSLERQNHAKPLTRACSPTRISDEHNHIALWPSQAVSSEGGRRLWLRSYIHPFSNVLANAFSLSFLICKTILAHLDKSFNVGKMPYFPN